MVPGRLFPIIRDLSFHPNLAEAALQNIPHVTRKLGDREDRGHPSNLADFAGRARLPDDRTIRAE
jgi:hypothetical protein